MTDKKALSARHVAQMLDVHVNTVKRIPIEDLPYFRLAARGDRRYVLSDVKAFIKKRMER